MLSSGWPAVSFSLASLMRSAITREIRARLLADTLRGSAETISDSDMLTGLPNRRNFFRELKKQLSARNPGNEFALAIADLDGFKPINDTFGHAVGDKLLFEVAQRLKAVCADKCFLARLGGDEFAIIVQGRNDAESLFALGEAIRKEIGRTYEIVGIKMSVAVSLGFVFEQSSALTESELIERADYALYRAKELKCGVVTYSQQHEIDRRNENAVAHALQSADYESEMSVVFQPQIDIRNGKTRGFEALARWSNSEVGFVPPDVFIRAAERTGLIEHLTPLLLKKALASAIDWPADMMLSFNLSIRDIVSPTAIDVICDVVRKSRFPATRLEFEVTETLVMTDFRQAQKSLETLRKLGARVALDDFGVGYTNFEYIDELSISTVKIDRSFVLRLANKGPKSKLIDAMIGLCDTLGIENVVEGVETEEQLAAIERAGARFVQGYFFSSPMPANEVASYLLREQMSASGDKPFRLSAAG
jgi:diguanylate cyclase (GGDEF)-like protein